MPAKKKKVDIKCTGSALLALDKITDFQGNLKRRSETHWQQIATSIEKYGFSFQFFIWKSGKTNYCLDGHGRLGALQRMAADGWQVPPLPVVYVQARDKAEAKQKLLRMNSQYGEFDTAGLQDFIADIEVDSGALTIPELSFIIPVISAGVEDTQCAGASPWDRMNAAAAGVVFHFGDIVERVPVELYDRFVEQKTDSIAEWLQNVLRT